jgi:hypothetical protein
MALSKTPFAATAIVILVAIAPARSLSAAPPSLLRIFGKSPQADAGQSDPRKLTEVDGPWMILATSFAGSEGRQKAERLADELSKDFGLPTFIHEENFDFTGKINQGGVTGRTLRYANQTQYQAFAVLVGEYDSVDHPQLIRDLKRIKVCKPKMYERGDVDSGAGEAETPMDAVKNLQRGLLKRVGKTPPGPLHNAFATTNPMLPEEYFLIPEVDSFVMELNSQVEYSLLDNPGKFTVVVATFAGLSTIVDGRKDKAFEPSSERMESCALNAHKMVRELRKQGVEAYEFHDRTRSLVTIGSFHSLGQTKPDGGFEYTPAIRRVMETHRAGSDQEPTQFGPGIRARHVASIPYDVHPTPIAVPRKSKRSLYSGRLGMR